ncbi:hypothetical protein CH379_017645 [Leptospira ellisii]|uniref:Uncharacterized protein n=1 Tax=Leptospira ellisii TaxID=2023197 RepID=A0AAE4QR60_9LEPT|nr:hypothetical protein [Leptospira ellisii]MDV6237461.1 hypothetical protein [Leptospira ellisii]
MFRSEYEQKRTVIENKAGSFSKNAASKFRENRSEPGPSKTVESPNKQIRIRPELHDK